MGLAPEIVQVIAELEPEARRKRIQMEFIEENSPPIIANAQLINILIRNIIDNVYTYKSLYACFFIYPGLKNDGLSASNTKNLTGESDDALS